VLPLGRTTTLVASPSFASFDDGATAVDWERDA
jgi:hypothetical protein